MLIARESPWPIPGVLITETVINREDRWNAHLYGRSVTTPMLMETSITTQQHTNAFYIQSPRLQSTNNPSTDGEPFRLLTDLVITQRFSECTTVAAVSSSSLGGSRDAHYILTNPALRRFQPVTPPSIWEGLDGIRQPHDLPAAVL